MTKAIAGFFRTRADAEVARDALVSAGFVSDRVSFVAGDTRGHEVPALGPIKDVEGDTELTKDAFLGSAIGLAVGMIAVFIPGLGALVAGGPLAGAIAGMSVGAGAGGLIGLLKDHGVDDDEAEFYAEGVKRGGALISVQYGNEDEEKRAREVMKEHGAIQTEELAPDLT
jgi:hypothetical protein